MNKTVNYIDRIHSVFLGYRYSPLCFKENQKRDEFENVKKIFLKDLSLKSFENIKNQRDRNCLATVIANIPPKVSIEKLGEESLFWAWNEVRGWEWEGRGEMLEREMMSEYLNHTGMDKTRLYNSRQGLFNKSKIKNSIETLRTYKIITNLKKSLNKIDLEKLLIINSNDNFKKNSGRINRYSLYAGSIGENFLYGEGYDELYNNRIPQKFNELTVTKIYFGTPLGLAIKYDGVPVAVTSLIPYKNNCLSTQQIQGINTVVINSKKEVIQRIKNTALFDLDWKKVLISINEELALMNKYDNSMILGAVNNKWTKVQLDDKIHLQLEDGLRIYDSTAESLGYKKHKDNNWYKKLK